MRSECARFQINDIQMHVTPPMYSRPCTLFKNWKLSKIWLIEKQKISLSTISTYVGLTEDFKSNSVYIYMNLIAFKISHASGFHYPEKFVRLFIELLSSVIITSSLIFVKREYDILLTILSISGWLIFERQIIFETINFWSLKMSCRSDRSCAC